MTPARLCLACRAPLLDDDAARFGLRCPAGHEIPHEGDWLVRDQYGHEEAGAKDPGRQAGEPKRGFVPEGPAARWPAGPGADVRYARPVPHKPGAP